VKLPDPVSIAPEAYAAIAARHGLRGRSLSPVGAMGIINSVYLLGDDLVLRVPRDHPGHIAQARVEAVAIPAARAVGVRTPALVAYDDARDLLPVPYMVVERVPGEAMGHLDLEPGATPDVWRELGRDLALLHSGVGGGGPAGGLARHESLPDPRELVEIRAADGWFTSLEARWLGAWLERLAAAGAQPPATERFLHLDVQATNVMVRPGSLGYLAILDWGCAGWGDPAWDFFGLPLRAAPLVLEGHREVARLDGDDTAEVRILWRHLQYSLTVLPRGAAPGTSWAERPLAWLLEVLRFFLEPVPPGWRSLAPEASFR
jgi:aminoglycoside phosphotransferase (APT) family kinase protein